jgi:5-hydroxyisourate hydrolase
LPGLSIHAIDVARGVVAAGMQVEVFALRAGEERQLVARGTISAKGTLDDALLGTTFTPGYYEAAFHVGAYYRAAGISLPKIPVSRCGDLPLRPRGAAAALSPAIQVHRVGYSCFRGGA